MEKFYWMLYCVSKGLSRKESSIVINKHPFDFLKIAKNGFEPKGYDTCLLDWKEITKEEYDLYRELGL